MMRRGFHYDRTAVAHALIDLVKDGVLKQRRTTKTLPIRAEEATVQSFIARAKSLPLVGVLNQPSIVQQRFSVGEQTTDLGQCTFNTRTPCDEQATTVFSEPYN